MKRDGRQCMPGDCEIVCYVDNKKGKEIDELKAALKLLLYWSKDYIRYLEEDNGETWCSKDEQLEDIATAEKLLGIGGKL